MGAAVRAAARPIEAAAAAAARAGNDCKNLCESVEREVGREGSFSVLGWWRQRTRTSMALLLANHREADEDRAAHANRMMGNFLLPHSLGKSTRKIMLQVARIMGGVSGQGSCRRGRSRVRRSDPLKMPRLRLPHAPRVQRLSGFWIQRSFGE